MNARGAVDEPFSCRWCGYPSDTHDPYSQVGRDHQPERSTCPAVWHRQHHGVGARCSECGMTVILGIGIMLAILVPAPWLPDTVQQFTYGQPVEALP